MSGRIVSRELIAMQAAAAAEAHVRVGPGAPLPPNPYCEHFEPDHHREWAASLQRALHLLLQLPESESCA